jgi:hypothetical protein
VLAELADNFREQGAAEFGLPEKALDLDAPDHREVRSGAVFQIKEAVVDQAAVSPRP